MPSEALEIAQKVLDIVPNSMADIRKEMRAASPPDLSVPQYRILSSIFRGRNLAGEIAKNQGISQPAMSKMIDSVVDKGLVRREKKDGDRRRIPLFLTDEGEALFLRIRRSALQEIGRRVSQLGARDRKSLLQGLSQLESIFGQDSRMGAGRGAVEVPAALRRE